MLTIVFYWYGPSNIEPTKQCALCGDPHTARLDTFIVLSPVLSCREEQSLAEEEVKEVTEDSIVEEPGRDQDKDKHQWTHFWIDNTVP